jgi:predicted RNA-binding Zn-ribbon protein involved in translation (DUF1610 family)
MTNRSTLVKLLAAAAALAAAAFLLLRGPGSGSSGAYAADHPYSKMAHFVCLDQAQPHDFSMTVGEYAAATRRGTSIVCPTCGSNDLSRAVQCPSCKAHVPQGRGSVTPTHCAACGTAMPNGKGDYFHAGTH